VHRLLAVVSCLALAASAEVVDRLAVAVGREVITESQLDEEIRIAAFLSRQPIVRGLDTRRAAVDRLVQQLLIRREVEVSRYPLPGEEDLDKYFEQIQGGFRSAAEFDQALRTYGLTRDSLREHLALQLTTLRFIEFRFQPEINISEAEIRASYERELATWGPAHSGAPPSLEASRESIRIALTEERIDRALDAWLQERRRRVRIAYVDASLH
jgi:DNA-binding transcriptional ArsR family regulator